MNGSSIGDALAVLAAADRGDAEPRGEAAVQRRDEVLGWLAAGQLVTPADKFAAAAILVRSERVADVEAAQTLAHAAMAGERRARAVAAAAFDRLRRLAGKPQKFGLEVVRADGTASLWPVDPATTDSERAKWDVPPLADLRRRCATGDRP